jgi:hypothetical protein
MNATPTGHYIHLDFMPQPTKEGTLYSLLAVDNISQYCFPPVHAPAVNIDALYKQIDALLNNADFKKLKEPPTLVLGHSEYLLQQLNDRYKGKPNIIFDEVATARMMKPLKDHLTAARTKRQAS